jgi:hypothetical protein
LGRNGCAGFRHTHLIQKYEYLSGIGIDFCAGWDRYGAGVPRNPEKCHIDKGSGADTTLNPQTTQPLDGDGLRQRIQIVQQFGLRETLTFADGREW